MYSKESAIQQAKCFYHTVHLPICINMGGSSAYSLPDQIPSAASVTGSAALAASPTDETGTVQYILSPAGESYIYLSLSGNTSVTVGPFLTEEITDETIAKLIRSGVIKMHFRAAMRSYYDSLSVITSQQYYYTGKLIEMLFLSDFEKQTPPENSDSAQSFIPASYYYQAHDYKSRQFMHSPYMTEQEICHYISQGDAESALHILAEINQRPRALLAGNAIRSLKNSIICSCAFMARAAISGGVRSDDAFTLSDAYIQQIESCGDIPTVLHLEREMVIGYTAAVNSFKAEQYSNAVSSTVSYIENHLCEKLTVAQIADAVYLNPNYLSGIFNRETGETIHNYILRRRIEDSAFFVKTSAEPIADIASFYQFSSQSHFVQCFRRFMGVTPGEYRKKE